MAEEGNIVTDVMATPEQVLAAGGVSRRRRGASRRSPSGQRHRAPTPEPPKDLPLDPDEELELKFEVSPTKPEISPTKPKISPSKPQISPTKPQISPTKSQNSPTAIEISSTNPPLSPTKAEISPTKSTAVKRISTTEKTLVTKRSHSSPGENRQSLPSSTVTSSTVKQEHPLQKSEDQAVNAGDVPHSKTVVVKRKSTTEKTLVTKRSLSSPGEGRQSLPQSATTGDLKQEVAAPRRRRLSDDSEKNIGDGAVMVVKKTLTSQPPVKTEEIVKVKRTVQEEKPIESLKANKSESSVPKKEEEGEQVSREKLKTAEVSLQKKPDEEKLSSSPQDIRSVEKAKPEIEDEKSPLLPVKEDEKNVREGIWGPFFREMWQEWKKFVAQHGEQWRKIISQRNRCIGAFLVMLIYCGIGGLIFRFTEGAFEAFYKCGVKRVKRDFVDSLWLGSHHLLEDDWKSQARKKLMELENQLHAAHEAGVTSYSGQRAWSFLNAVVYSITVVTTIGYGHISPSTTTGRAVTIVYAIFGIPMFLILLADFGKLFTRGIKFIWAFVRRVYYTGSCKKVRRTVPVQEVMKGVQLVYDFATFRRPSQMVVGETGEDGRRAPMARPEDLELQVPLNPVHQTEGLAPPTLPIDGQEPPTTPALSTFEVDDEFNLPISVAIVILVIYIFVGAVIYWTWENWGFFESFYFVFISMSTIGFGDFVPQHPMYMMASIVYLVFGLALTSMCINVVQEKLSDSFRQASAKIGATIGLRINEEDGVVTPVPPPQIELPEVHNTISKSQST